MENEGKAERAAADEQEARKERRVSMCWLPMASPLEDAQLIAGILRHLIGRPGRIENDLDFDVAHAGKSAEDLLAVGDELRPGGAHGTGHRHFDLAGRLVFGCWNEIDVVNQTQVDDVDEQLGIDDVFELFADEVFAEMSGWRDREARISRLGRSGGSQILRRRTRSSPNSTPAANARSRSAH